MIAINYLRVCMYIKPQTARLRRYLTTGLSHLDSEGRASMVDVGHKPFTQRTAIATAHVDLGKKISGLLSSSTPGSNISKSGYSKKGDVFTTAQLAGIMGAKRTSELIPLCHGLNLSHVNVDLEHDHSQYMVKITASASTTAATGVEMEALTAASIAALTIYDMCKAGGKGICIREVRLEGKTGGVSGDYQRKNT